MGADARYKKSAHQFIFYNITCSAPALYEILINITPEQWNRTVVHPEYNKQMTLWYLLGMYAWHSRHHTAHINSLRERMGWN
jgi:hypothetical protein